MPKRKIALHGRISGAPQTTVQKYIITIAGELRDATCSKEAKERIFKAVQAAAKGIPGAIQIVILHQMLDELLADFITHTGGLPSKTTLMGFLEWSHQQTLDPTEDK